MSKLNAKSILHALLHVFWVFPVRKNRIVFQSFNGTDYSDSCRAVAEYLNASAPDAYEMYWVSKDASRLRIPEGTRLTVVKKHSLKFMYLCLTAGVIVCNILPEEYLPLRRKQKVANTWHGMPYKVVGKESTGSTALYKRCSLYLSLNRFYTERVIRDSFGFDGEILECGLPRNDVLLRPLSDELNASVRNYFGVDAQTRIALFAPTFRGKFQNQDIGLDYDGVRRALTERFGGEWVILYRAHPMLAHTAENIPGVLSATAYPDMADLLAVSDVLLTDYSSSMWDFCLTRRPVFLFAPDIDQYAGDRGFYFDMESLPFPMGHSNGELTEKITGFDDRAYASAVEQYLNDIGCFERGHATETLADKIAEWC